MTDHKLYATLQSNFAKDDCEENTIFRTVQNTIVDYHKKPDYVNEKDYYSNRTFEVVEVFYGLLYWYKHDNSRKAIVINTNHTQRFKKN